MSKSRKRRKQERGKLNTRNARRRQKYAGMVFMQGVARVSDCVEERKEARQQTTGSGMTNRQKKRQKLGKDPLGAVGATGIGKHKRDPYAFSSWDWR